MESGRVQRITAIQSCHWHLESRDAYLRSADPLARSIFLGERWGPFRKAFVPDRTRCPWIEIEGSTSSGSRVLPDWGPLGRVPGSILSTMGFFLIKPSIPGP